MNKKLITSISLAAAALLSTGSVYAAGYGTPDCNTSYGAGTNCPQISFTIDKKVQTPTTTTKGGVSTSNYVDNLTLNDARYQPGNSVNFSIKVTNNGTDSISNIDVVDSFPEYLTFKAGQGVYDKNARTLKFSVQNLGAGQSKEYIVTSQIADTKTLPADSGVVCVTNTVLGQDNKGLKGTDASQLCIEKPGVIPAPQVMPAVPLKNAPATGPETMALMGLIPSGLLGMFLKRKSK